MGLHCATCQPQCSSKQCGDDGCGGSCGECGAASSCQGGLCRRHCWPGECANSCAAAKFITSTVAKKGDTKGTYNVFRDLKGGTVDDDGAFYVADGANHVIHRVTPDGKVSIFAGVLENPKLLPWPRALAWSPNLNHLYVIASGPRLVLVSKAGVVSQLADPSTLARHVAVSPVDGRAYLATTSNTIEVRLASGKKSHVFGNFKPGHKDGPIQAATFNDPRAVALDEIGHAYVLDGRNRAIRRFEASKGTNAIVTTLFDSSSISSSTAFPAGGGGSNLVWTPQLGLLFDDGGARVLRLDAAGRVSTIAGSVYASIPIDGPGKLARLRTRRGLTADRKGNLWVSEQYRIRHVQLPTACDDGDVCTVDSCTGEFGKCHHERAPGCMLPSGAACKPVAWPVTTVAGAGAGIGDGALAKARFYDPVDLHRDDELGLLVADAGNHRIRRISRAGVVTTLAGKTKGYLDGTGTAARLNSPAAIARWNDDAFVVADRGNRRLRLVGRAGAVSTLAGSGKAGGFKAGTGIAATFKAPTALAALATGGAVVVDQEAHLVATVSATAKVAVLAGSGSAGFVNGKGIVARFSSPGGVAVDGAGIVYVADTGNRRIRRIAKDGTVTTLAGSGKDAVTDGPGALAAFRGPAAIAVDRAGIYVGDATARVLRLVGYDGGTSTVAGKSGAVGATDGIGKAARFGSITGIVSDGAGNLYLVDRANHRIRHVRRPLMCDDNDPCTIDACVVPTGKASGTCKRTKIAGCKTP